MNREVVKCIELEHHGIKIKFHHYHGFMNIALPTGYKGLVIHMVSLSPGVGYIFLGKKIIYFFSSSWDDVDNEFQEQFHFLQLLQTLYED